MKSPIMNHADIQLLLADYRDLRGAERREVDAHVATCPQCAGRLAEYRRMDAELQGLRDARPAPALRNGYYAAVRDERATANSRSAQPRRPLLYGLGATAAVVALVAGIVFLLRPGAPGGNGVGRGTGREPVHVLPVKSAEVGSFVWQTDGVYGYEMLRPAEWSMADVGELRSYSWPITYTDGSTLGLLAVNPKVRSSYGNENGGLRDIAASFDAAPNLVEWSKSVEAIWAEYGPPITRIAEVPDAVIFQQEYDATSRVRISLVALTVKEGQPLVIALDAGGPIASLETLKNKGIWDDFLTMIASIRPIPPDANNVSPWAPTATPTPDAPLPAVTPAPTARPRDPNTTEVTLDVYSGLPNPTWPLTPQQTRDLRIILDALPEAACEPLAQNLGYRGFVVQLGQPPELSNEYRLRVVGGQVRWGDPWTPDAATLCASDAEGQVARFLLESGREQLPDGLYEMAAQEILAEELPDAWQRYVDETLSISLAYPLQWELTQDTGQSRLFNVKQTEPSGPSFPAFYVTVMPQGFTNEDVSAYNFWSEEEVAKARALNVGESGEVHGAEGYNIYTRLPDAKVSGETAVVVESDKVWDGGPGVKDRRVLVTRDDKTYMFGAYYSAAEELRTFERLLTSVVFLEWSEPSVTPTPDAVRHGE